MAEVAPLISIVVPVHNVEPYVAKCVRSLQAQTYGHFEAIMVDDGSTDGSYEACRAAIGGDTRFRLFRNPVCQGVAAARNVGLEQAGGSLLGFVDPDDWIEPDMYAVLYAAHAASGADIVQCGYFNHLLDGRVLENGVEKGGCFDTHAALELLFADKAIQTFLWNKLYRKSLFDGVRFPQGRTFEDMLALPSVFERAGRVCIVEGCKYHYVERYKGIVSQAFNENRWADYLYALNAKRAKAEALGVWKDSERFVVNMYLRFLDRCLVSPSLSGRVAGLRAYLKENVKGGRLWRQSPYLAFRRSLCLHCPETYRMFTLFLHGLKRKRKGGGNGRREADGTS